MTQHADIETATKDTTSQFLNVSGEVINPTNKVIDNVWVVITLYDSNNQTIGSGIGPISDDDNGMEPNHDYTYESAIPERYISVPFSQVDSFSLKPDWIPLQEM